MLRTTTFFDLDPRDVLARHDHQTQEPAGHVEVESAELLRRRRRRLTGDCCRGRLSVFVGGGENDVTILDSVISQPLLEQRSWVEWRPTLSVHLNSPTNTRVSSVVIRSCLPRKPRRNAAASAVSMAIKCSVPQYFTGKYQLIIAPGRR